jgi:hypothetical protein
MEKWLCWGSLAIAGLLLLLFLLDLIIKFPFTGYIPGDGGSPFLIIDILGILACGALGYMAWNASRDLRNT